MDSLGFWIYLIVAVIYLIGRAFKKAAPQTPPKGRPSRRAGSPVDEDEANETGPPMSFEELLREITEAKRPKAPEAPPQTKPKTTVQRPRVPQPTLQRRPEPPKPTYVDYDDNIPDEIQDVKEEGYDYKGKGSVFETYENAKREAFSRPSLEEGFGIGQPGEIAREVEYGRFGAFSLKKKDSIINDYIEELRNPSGFKKAFVLSEILNRKY